MQNFPVLRDPSSADVTLAFLIVQNVRNVVSDPALNAAKETCAQTLRERFAEHTRAQLKTIPPLDVFFAYYRKFGYSYHVLLQIESVLRGKPLPTVSTAVEAMFMAELQNAMLTSGHDLAHVQFPLTLRLVNKGETAFDIRGNVCDCVEGDFAIEDGQGIISTILRGPDERTRIRETTRDVLYIAYGPKGIGEESLLSHLCDLEAAVKLFSPEAVTIFKNIV